MAVGQEVEYSPTNPWVGGLIPAFFCHMLKCPWSLGGSGQLHGISPMGVLSVGVNG